MKLKAAQAVTARFETHEQREVVKWLRAAGVLFCSVPNGARVKPWIANQLKAEGMQAGVPDLLIFDRPSVPWRDPPPSGTAIEMKRTAGGRLSKEQKEWHDHLRHLGWVVIVANGAADAFAQLTELGYTGLPTPNEMRNDAVRLNRASKGFV